MTDTISNVTFNNRYSTIPVSIIDKNKHGLY
jgi:hypothetical protein